MRKPFIVISVVIITLILSQLVSAGLFADMFRWAITGMITSDVQCTDDVRLCSDGSYVARIPPYCNFAPCPVVAVCTDTDGGKNYNVKGYSIGVTGVRWDDRCNPNDGKLVETYCNGENVNFISYACPNGCSDGVCIQNTTGFCGDGVCSSGESCGPCPQDCKCVRKCTDSDGGISYNLKGFTSYKLYMNGALIANNTMVDTCSGSNLLYEYYCSVNNETVYVTKACTCSNGACQPQPPITNCTDSDGGINYYVNDIHEGCNFNFYQSHQGLTEYYCSDGTKRGLEYDCMTEDKYCRGGICTQNRIVTISEPGCVDTDGGVNEFVKGTAGSNEDHCINDYTLYEVYCNRKSSFPELPVYAVQHIYCENGCENGVCLKQPIVNNCTDSDGGKNYNVKGYSIGVTGVRWDDNCNPNDGKLVETYCNGENVNFFSYACPNGCSNGVCIQGPAVCTTEYAPVCGQPPTPICSAGQACLDVIPQPKTYGNMCLLNAAGATFLYTGQCRVNTCTDSDSGKNYKVKGTARTSDGLSKTDYCTVGSETDSGGYLAEFYCDGAVIRDLGYNCPNGCSDGVCVETISDRCIAPTGVTCSNLRACSSSQEVEFRLYNVMGQGIIISDFELSGCYMKSISEIGEIPNGGSVRIVEKCSGLVAGKQTNRSYALKYYASHSSDSFTKILRGQIFVTPGPCLSQTCTDTDGGINYYVKGACTDSGGYNPDSCATGSNGHVSLSERYCNEVGQCDVAKDPVTNQYGIHCEYGCENGACVKNTMDIPLTLAVDDASPASDVAMLVKLGTRLEEYGYNVLPGRLFSDVDTSQLDNKVTVAIYYGDAIIIVGVHSPAEHVQLAIKAKNILSDEMNASVQTILSEAVTVSNLKYMFNAECTDTDGGKNYNVPGVTTTDTIKSADYCAQVNQNRLYEFYCTDGEVKSIGYNCPYGCANGACISSQPPVETCTDSDGGKNYNIKGTARTSDGLSKTDYCTVGSETDSGGYLAEFYCEGAIITSFGYACPNGCEDGACIGEPSVSTCDDGCLQGTRCIPYGTRVGRTDTIKYPSYCNINGEFTRQNSDGAVCQNSYECMSNYCTDGKCINLEKQTEETQSMLKQILNWFKKIFGA